MSTNKSTWKKLTSMRLFMPLVCLLAIIIVATITIPGFLSMSLKNGVPYGYPVDVINRASELVILSVGMTLVTAASGGQDISVGAVMAVAAAVRNSYICLKCCGSEQRKKCTLRRCALRAGCLW